MTTVLYTDSEFFSNGTALELAHTKDGKELMLLECATGSVRLAPTIECNGVTYAPGALDDTLAHRLVLPSDLRAHGSTSELVGLIQNVILSTGVIDEANARVASYFAIASTVADQLATAPFLAISGTLAAASQFLRVLARCCRHSICLSEVSARIVCTISITSVHPTLLAIQLVPDRATTRWLSGSSQRGFVVASGTKLRDSFCAKAVFLGDDMAQPPEAVRVHLLSVAAPNTVTESKLDGIAAEVQPRLLSYRLAFRTALLRGDEPAKASSTSQGCRSLLSAFFEESVQGEIAELLREQVEDAATDRSMSPKAMLVECGLAVCHEGQPEVKVGELAELLNVALAGRGEPEVESRKVGALLKDVGLLTKRLDHRGRGLVLSQDICRRLHRLARDFHVPVAVSGEIRCALCSEFWG